MSIVMGVFGITAGIIIIINREKLARSDAKRQKKYYGKLGRMSVEAGLASAGHMGMTGIGFIFIGVGQIVLGVFGLV